MKSMLVAIGLGLAPAYCAAQEIDFRNANIVFLGELHDNPAHHQAQAEWVAQMAPKALVFEMLTGTQAAQHIPGADQDRLDAALGWSTGGWPDFSMYYPIFAAAPQAEVFGAGVPRERARELMDIGLPKAFGEGADLYGLSQDLPDAEQNAREALQMMAHCDALPPSVLPMMVDIQRLRDGELARMAIRAYESTGGPVAVITGNGHARRDWGAPSYVTRINPQLALLSIGQGEQNMPAPNGGFDYVISSAAVVREDPCADFK